MVKQYNTHKRQSEKQDAGRRVSAGRHTSTHVIRCFCHWRQFLEFASALLLLYVVQVDDTPAAAPLSYFQSLDEHNVLSFIIQESDV
jgi:hypothetical protein